MGSDLLDFNLSSAHLRDIMKIPLGREILFCFDFDPICYLEAIYDRREEDFRIEVTIQALIVISSAKSVKCTFPPSDVEILYQHSNDYDLVEGEQVIRPGVEKEELHLETRFSLALVTYHGCPSPTKIGLGLRYRGETVYQPVCIDVLFSLNMFKRWERIKCRFCDDISEEYLQKQKIIRDTWVLLSNILYHDVARAKLTEKSKKE
ncbi:hypothetical protein IV203_026188 [Nitzschia inconspicua]|uniref:Uncharacterized protein n=1 Tax=Nitzschia inconspicua TaxID=303405 RepID=A0A9K3LIU1_9STRA|nr:hypothetical protein IV203_026188 [Nitzschia inconspicua]